ncbi:MAG: glycosyltransferase family 4 protein [Leptolyngbyaceae cyanobacterium bins.302]|nr:glycosyltransferase family 4 protein [Leptolyngbyaceae cyanobacterium bins.302]
MSIGGLKVLMIAEQCNPDWASVPLVAYNFYKEISQIVDVTLVTHGRNRAAFEANQQHSNITYIDESEIAQKYHKLIGGLITKGQANWPLYLALSYPIYAEFNREVYRLFGDQVRAGNYDLVHSITPMMPRYPVAIIKACQNTPFLLGPVNGGVPFPEGFRETAKKEKTFWNFLKPFGRFLIPGYVETYKRADRILSGSTYTLNMLKQLFGIDDGKVELFFENGISNNFLQSDRQKRPSDQVNLLFVGRLVPYKGADLVIEALGKLEPALRNKLALTIVGDGSERQALERRVQELNLQNVVTFVGWVKQYETQKYYSQADIFCFPSVREFGGAVVMEAMACGLPCIVVDNGGIAEYVTEGTGFKIKPISRDYVIQEMSEKIQCLVKDTDLRSQMARQAIERAKEFEWSAKAKQMVEIYTELAMQREIQVEPTVSVTI